MIQKTEGARSLTLEFITGSQLNCRLHFTSLFIRTGNRMTLIISSVIFAALLIIISKLPVAISMGKQTGGYDNRHPRKQQANLTNFGQRALGAHINSIEAFPIFATGVCLALISQANIVTVQNLCVIFSCARIAYLICYWFDIDKVRSIIWTIGFGACIWLMALALL